MPIDTIGLVLGLFFFFSRGFHLAMDKSYSLTQIKWYEVYLSYEERLGMKMREPNSSQDKRQQAQIETHEIPPELF